MTLSAFRVLRGQGGKQRSERIECRFAAILSAAKYDFIRAGLASQCAVFSREKENARRTAHPQYFQYQIGFASSNVEASSCLLPEELAAEACIPGWDCRIRDENPISELIDHDLASGPTAANNTAT